MLFWIASFTFSAFLTALGVLKAYRGEMRVWIGEGLNQARTLLLAMLIVSFFFVCLAPLTGLLIFNAPINATPSSDEQVLLPVLFIGFLTVMFVGPLVIVLTLDWIGRRVLADRPGKFGAKVPTLGKWSS